MITVNLVLIGTFGKWRIQGVQIFYSTSIMPYLYTVSIQKHYYITIQIVKVFCSVRFAYNIKQDAIKAQARCWLVQCLLSRPIVNNNINKGTMICFINTFYNLLVISTPFSQCHLQNEWDIVFTLKYNNIDTHYSV